MKPEPVWSEPVTTEPVTTEPVTAEPIWPEPVTAEPIWAEPLTAERIWAEPLAAEPVWAEPLAAKPIWAEPLAAEPVWAEPLAAEPIWAEPLAAEPIWADPLHTEPVITEPVFAEPIFTEPAHTEPVHAEPVLTEPVHAEPIPAPGTSRRQAPHRPAPDPPTDPDATNSAAATDDVPPQWTGRLRPDSQALLEAFARDDVRPYNELSVLQARSMVAGATRLQGLRIPVAQVRDVLINNSPGRLPARIYHPNPARLLPLVVYLHGGGFVTGSVAVADRPCRALAVAAASAILSVEYRLAPENPFPVPLHDCLTAVRWAVANAAEIGIDAGRIVLMGDSAGGALAAACSLSLRDAGNSPVIAQVLVYPTLRPTRGNPSLSLVSNGEGYSMTRGSLEWFWDHYLGRPEDTVDPLAAPLLAADFSGLPPTTMVVAEFDPLRDEGLDYARRLRHADVPVQTHLVLGALHGFWWMDKVLGQATELTEYLAGDLRATFA